MLRSRSRAIPFLCGMSFMGADPPPLHISLYALFSLRLLPQRNLVGTRMQHTLGCAKNPIVAASDKLLQISSTPHHRNSESRELILCRARIKIFTFWPCRPGLFRRGSVWGCGCWPAGLAGPPPRCKADLLFGLGLLARRALSPRC